MAVPLITNLNIGKYLKIVSKGAVYNNLSEDSELWTMVKQKKAGPAEGRENRFLLRNGYGAAAAGFLPLNGGSYPEGQQSDITEGILVYKDYAVTIEVERTLIAKAVQDLSRYGEPLAEELRAKTITMSRLLSYRAYGDGSGVLAEAEGAGTIVSGRIVADVLGTSSALGFVGNFQFGDKVNAFTKAGVEVTPTVSSGSFDTFKVEDFDREAETVTLSARDSSGTELTVTVTNLSAGDVWYRKQQKTNGNIIDISSISSSVDRNTLSETWAGLESLSADDGRLVNGITMEGALKGTRKSLGGAAIDSQDFQQIMSQLMIKVGQGRYKYTKPLMAWETLDALIESRETDRRFQSIKDNKRGVEMLGYVHGKNTLIFTADEFCPKQRVYILPEGDVVQFHGGDFEFVNPDGSGQKFFLKPNGSGHDRTIRAYMEGQGALNSVHSAAIGVLTNFTV